MMASSRSVALQQAILVVVEERTERDAISASLRGDGYFVLAVSDGAVALDLARENPLSLVLLDSVLAQPGVVELCRQLRAQATTGQIPLLLLVNDTLEIAHLASLQLNVNDYMKKPLNWDELRACTRALLRKQRPARSFNRLRQELLEGQEQLIIVDDLSIDIARRKVARHDVPIDLQRALLFDLLVYLVRNRGIVLTRERLLKQVWGYESVSDHDSRTVDVHVRWLREKLETDPNTPQLIQTVRGVGYCFKD